LHDFGGATGRVLTIETSNSTAKSIVKIDCKRAAAQAILFAKLVWDRSGVPSEGVTN